MAGRFRLRPVVLALAAVGSSFDWLGENAQGVEKKVRQRDEGRKWRRRVVAELLQELRRGARKKSLEAILLLKLIKKLLLRGPKPSENLTSGALLIKVESL